MEPFFTNDAIVLGFLLLLLALIFYTSSSENSGFKKFYRIVPALLLCYFLPALLHWPLNLIASHWYDNGLLEFLALEGVSLPADGMSFEEIKKWWYDSGVVKYLANQELALPEEGMNMKEIKKWFADQKMIGAENFERHSQLYFVASRYLLPASLVLLCLGIDFQGIINLGWRSIVMFLAATLGIIIGGPIALLVVNSIFPDLIAASNDDLWRGLATVAGSWIGGGANQTAMKEIFEVKDDLFATMIIVDVVVANIWMGFLLYGANMSEKVDSWLNADSSAIDDLKKRVADYQSSISKMPTTTSIFMLLGVAFGAVAISHWGKDVITPIFETINDASKELLAADGSQIYPEGKINAWGLSSIMSGFFWLIVISTTIGLLLSLTKAKKLEGVGASRWGSVFIYILVATIGMKMNLGEVWANIGLFAIGITWMLVHVIILLIVAKVIKAPFFFVAVGSQANVGGAASAPVVASAFSPTLAPVGVLMAVLGYALGTYGALICAYLMQAVSGG